jgi:hypothetical protein
MTYDFQYSNFIFDEIIFQILAAIGTIILIWSLLTDVKQFFDKKTKTSIIPIIFGIMFTSIIWVWNIQIEANFNKPSLLRIYYDGDYNGTSIDFKKDGTYIYDNFAIGFSNFVYGTYIINGNIITLDDNSLDNISTKQLKIISKEVEYAHGKEMEKHVYQTDTNNVIVENTTEFRLILDNREY